jgi:hypothetical protein
MSTIQNAIAEVVVESTSNTGILDKISTEQKAALEAKFNALPIEVRSTVAAKYPGMSTVALYIVRQVVKEANSKLASNQRPVWYNVLLINAPALFSGDKTVKEYAEKQLRNLAEDIDSKESVSLLRKYKNNTDRNTSDPHIKQLAGIFGVEVTTLK